MTANDPRGIVGLDPTSGPLERRDTRSLAGGSGPTSATSPEVAAALESVAWEVSESATSSWAAPR